MSPLAGVVLSSVAGVAAVIMLAIGLMQDRPRLDRTMEHLRRSQVRTAVSTEPGVAERVVASMARLAERSPWSPDPVRLRLVGLTPEAYAARLLLAFMVGLVGPGALVGVLQFLGVVPPALTLPLVVSLIGAFAAPALVHLRTVERSHEIQIDLRHQLSAYLDVVTMLLAANTGYEGALEQAAHAGDGRLFRELRRRQRRSSASGRSLVEALDATGVALGLVELQQVAATAWLSATEGAPVARSLAAKCSTIRSTLATDHEAEARLRTSRLTGPLVGMALIFMALVIYPALGSS